jgi:hypothetical protein
VPNNNLEVWKLVALFGVGPIVALTCAVLAYLFGRSLEDKKFRYKLKEIIHANTEKRRLEVLEHIANLTGEVVFRMWFVGNVIDPINKPINRRPDENREDWMRRRFRVRTKQLNEEYTKLRQARQGGSIYLTPELETQLDAIQLKISSLLDDYINKMLNSPTIGAEVFQAFKGGFEEAKEHHQEIVLMIRKMIAQ